MNYDKKEVGGKMGSNNDKYRYYLMDLGPYLKRFAFEQRKNTIKIKIINLRMVTIVHFIESFRS